MTQPPTTLLVVPAWVDGRLQAIVNAPVIHLEHSMYGPITAYLHTFFPPNQSFMIKPQGMLRPEYYSFDTTGFSDFRTQEDAPMMTRDEILEWIRGLKEGDEVAETQAALEPVTTIFDRHGPVELDIFRDTDGGESDTEEPDPALEPNTSLASNDSYGVGIKHTNKGIRYPGFIIVKATESLNDDRILLVVEVKKSDDGQDAARLQIREYLELAANKRRVMFLQGLLIMGATTECYFLDSLDDNPGGISNPVYFHTTGPQLKTRLHEIAIANLNQ
ncbi:hypothetical protein BD779DRAFT_1795869 [Infundibulicybe gibba]|nr:hypothetical protein BD779DRAFT_1795869 [Infundibulicybe gibba]